MLKAVLVATTALTIAGSTLAYAQQGGRERDPQRRWQPSIEDIRAFQAARLAALRAGTGAQRRAGEALAGVRAGGA